MIAVKLFVNTISALENGLQFSETKNRAIAQNIANVDTPNYKAKTVSFKDILEDTKMQQLPAYKTTEKHMDFKQINREQAIIDRSSFRFRHDGNGVDMDTEQAELAKNQIYYNAVVDRLNGKFNKLQTVIKGGR